MFINNYFSLMITIFFTISLNIFVTFMFVKPTFSTSLLLFTYKVNIIIKNSASYMTNYRNKKFNKH